MQTNTSNVETRSQYEAIITIQRARVYPHIYGVSQQKSQSYACVRLQIMVPKGAENVTVPTNCVTDYCRSLNPIWNNTFKLPVIPSSDVIVFQLYHRKRPRFKPQRSSKPNITDEPTPDPDATSSSGTTASNEQEEEEDEKNEYDLDTNSSRSYGDYIGLCLLPVARIPIDGSISHQVLELFTNPSQASIGRLYVATKMQINNYEIITENKLKEMVSTQNIQSTHLLDRSRRYRFLGIGDLAAFLFSEGHFTTARENWQHAIRMLAQQLAFRINQIKSSNDDDDRNAYLQTFDDEETLELAKRRIIKDGGLWDGV